METNNNQNNNVAPAPVAPEPVAPAPVAPEPVAPAPVTPEPVAPASVTPEPVAPASVTPEPVAPAPVAPEPVAPAPVAPEPVAPAPVAPEPVAQPVPTPTPVGPTPVAPVSGSVNASPSPAAQPVPNNQPQTAPTGVGNAKPKKGLDIKKIVSIVVIAVCFIVGGYVAYTRYFKKEATVDTTVQVDTNSTNETQNTKEVQENQDVQDIQDIQNQSSNDTKVVEDNSERIYKIFASDTAELLLLDNKVFYYYNIANETQVTTGSYSITDEKLTLVETKGYKNTTCYTDLSSIEVVFTLGETTVTGGTTEKPVTMQKIEESALKVIPDYRSLNVAVCQ